MAVAYVGRFFQGPCCCLFFLNDAQQSIYTCKVPVNRNSRDRFWLQMFFRILVDKRSYGCEKLHFVLDQIEWHNRPDRFLC
jgi:hypothetical protein